jgi:peptidoglycan/LPS O-acetylase OafA/YrhL
MKASLDMTTVGGTQQQKAGRDLTRQMRGAATGLMVMLILQFGLGIGVNLFITPKKGGIGEAFSNGPLLALHAILGVLIFLAAIGLLNRAITARHRVLITAAAIGLGAVLGALINGAFFLKNGANGPSMGMAVSGLAAMLCYTVCLRVLGSGQRGPA